MKIKVKSLLLGIIFLIEICIMLAQLISVEAVISISFAFSFILLIMLWLYVATIKISKVNIVAISICIITVICVLLNLFFTKSIPSITYFNKMIMFISSLLFFALMCDMDTEQKVVNFVFKLNSLVCVVLIVFYVFKTDEVYIFNGLVTEYLTFGFTNPNTTGMFLFALSLMEMIQVFAASARKSRIVHLLLYGIIGYFIFETQSRNCILVAALLLLTYIIFFICEKKGYDIIRSKNFNLFSGVIALLPIVFACLYMLLIYTDSMNFFELVIDSSKELDSRWGVWSIAMTTIMDSPLIGAYGNLAGGSGHFQMHNTHLDVCVSYGIIVFGLFIYFLYVVLEHCRKRINGRVNTACYLAFCAMLVTGIGEAALFSGGLGIYIYAGFFLMLAGHKFEKNNGAEITR